MRYSLVDSPSPGLPASLEAEKGLLACVLLGGGDIIDQVMDQVGSDSAAHDLFYDIRMQMIWRLMSQSHREGKPLDAISLSIESKKDNIVDVGEILTSGLEESSPSSANFSYYLGELKDLAERRRLYSILGEAHKRIIDTSHPIEELRNDLETKITSTSIAPKNVTFSSSRDAVQKTIAKAEERYASGGKLGGIPTGYKDLDEMTDGWQNGDLNLIAARPSQGKTALLISLAYHPAFRGTRTLFVTCEMNDEQLANRALCSAARVDLLKFRRSQLNEAEFKRIATAAAKISAVPLDFMDFARPTIVQIDAACRRYQRAHPDLGLIVVDYIQKIRSDRYTDSKAYEIEDVTVTLKSMAKSMNVPVLSAAQLHRDTQKQSRRPNLADLSDSSALEKESDVVGMIYHPQISSDDDHEVSTECTPAELMVLKNRNGPTDPIHLVWFKRFARFDPRFEGEIAGQ